MKKQMKSIGLCATCNYQFECLSFKNSNRSGVAILHCEEFDDSAINQNETPSLNGDRFEVRSPGIKCLSNKQC